MRAPEFWDGTGGPIGILVSGLLAPIGAALDAAGRLRRAVVRPYRAPVPVICVGNLVAGGSGKTPVVLSLAAMLARRETAAHIVMRGYGGRLKGPVRVDPKLHDARAVGDEALLAAERAPCWMARDRAAGARAAAAAGADVILLDDGFQNPHLVKDLSLLVVDAAFGFGNRRLIPAGPLREHVVSGLARADGVVLVNGGGASALCDLHHQPCPVFHAALTPIGGTRFAARRVLAFAGIGRPAKFFASLRACGAQIAGERPFPDHHRYRESELAALRRDANRVGAVLVTTAKDWVRLPPPARVGIEVLAVELHWRDEGAVEAFLSRILAPRNDGERGRR